MSDTQQTNCNELLAKSFLFIFKNIMFPRFFVGRFLLLLLRMLLTQRYSDVSLRCRCRH